MRCEAHKAHRCTKDARVSQVYACKGKEYISALPKLKKKYRRSRGERISK